jgi:hypothetical protein
MIISPEERAHDLADMASNWQLEQIVKTAKQEGKKVTVNLHKLYHKYYEELLNVFKQDELFNEELQNKD